MVPIPIDITIIEPRTKLSNRRTFANLESWPNVGEYSFVPLNTIPAFSDQNNPDRRGFIAVGTGSILVCNMYTNLTKWNQGFQLSSGKFVFYPDAIQFTADSDGVSTWLYGIGNSKDIPIYECYLKTVVASPVLQFGGLVVSFSSSGNAGGIVTLANGTIEYSEQLGYYVGVSRGWDYGVYTISNSYINDDLRTILDTLGRVKRTYISR